MEMNFRHGDNIFTLNVDKTDEGYIVKIDDKEYKVRADEFKPGLLQIDAGEGVHKFVVSVNKDERHIFQKGGVFKLERLASADQSAMEEDKGDLNSPITGKVVSIKVSEGDEVEEGQTLIILEAMKMEYQIKAPAPGTVTKIHFEEGKPVDMGALLLDLQEKE